MLVGESSRGRTDALPAFLQTIDSLDRGCRRLIAVAGPPGSGKSTFSESLQERLNRRNPNRARILPMDGFHYDDAVLEERRRRAQKGAPDTFDVGGLSFMLARLKANDAAEVAVPVFDRGIEISRAAARIITRDVDIVIVEGNYLLLMEIPWARLRDYFDLSLLIETPLSELRARLQKRWDSYGLSPGEIAAKIEGNDLPNAKYVLENSHCADFIVSDANWKEMSIAEPQTSDYVQTQNE